jgi:hypothetical protein
MVREWQYLRSGPQPAEETSGVMEYLIAFATFAFAASVAGYIFISLPSA